MSKKVKIIVTIAIVVIIIVACVVVARKKKNGEVGKIAGAPIAKPRVSQAVATKKEVIGGTVTDPNTGQVVSQHGHALA